jgi:beta-glucosidase
MQRTRRASEVLISSFPFAIEWSQENVPAILHLAHNSQEEGNALADALLGITTPADGW